MISRRSFIKSAAALTGSFFLKVVPWRSQGAEAVASEGREHLDGVGLNFFTPLQRTALGQLCDDVYPGAAKLGSVIYIETLLSAFDSDPPKIYAGGPFSGRGAAPQSSEVTINHFESFMPLNRYQEAAWRLYLYGESGISGGSPNKKILGPKQGLREIFYKGVEATSRMIPESGLVTKPTSVSTLFGLLDAECRTALRNLTLESCFAAPEYGGNRGLEGWKSIHYRGDVAPYGYSHFDESTQSYSEDPLLPVSKADPGPDLDPMTTGAQLFFNLVTRFTHGKKFY